jgi:hypothetical protein
MHVAEAPKLRDLLVEIKSERLVEVMQLGIKDDGRNYVHWDKLRHLDPPASLTHEEWWLLIKFARQPLLRTLPLADFEGESFSYAVPDLVARGLHHIDQRCSGEIAMPEVVTADEQA